MDNSDPPLNSDPAANAQDPSGNVPSDTSDQTNVVVNPAADSGPAGGGDVVSAADAANSGADPALPSGAAAIVAQNVGTIPIADSALSLGPFRSFDVAVPSLDQADVQAVPLTDGQLTFDLHGDLAGATADALAGTKLENSRLTQSITELDQMMQGEAGLEIRSGFRSDRTAAQGPAGETATKSSPSRAADQLPVLSEVGQDGLRDYRGPAGQDRFPVWTVSAENARRQETATLASLAFLEVDAAADSTLEAVTPDAGKPGQLAALTPMDPAALELGLDQFLKQIDDVGHELEKVLDRSGAMPWLAALTVAAAAGEFARRHRRRSHPRLRLAGGPSDATLTWVAGLPGSLSTEDS
jgi:hypothetical protein